MNTVFITGASGFIGLNTVKAFVEHKWHVFAIIHKNIDNELKLLAKNNLVTLLQADVTNFDSLENAIKPELANNSDTKIIVHCAGHASDVGTKKLFKQTNYESIKHITKLTKEFNFDKFIFVSTTDVYGLKDFNGETEGELILHNNRKNLYPKFKIKSEHWVKQNLPKDKYVIIRPAAIWGVGDKTLTPRITSFLKTSPFIIHFGRWKGQNRWPLAHVENVSNAIFCAAISNEVNGQAINIIDEENISIDKFYKTLAKIYYPNKKYKTITLPLWIGILIGKCVTTISNLLRLKYPFIDPSLYAVYSVSSNLDFSHERLKKLLNTHGYNLINFNKGCEKLCLYKQNNEVIYDKK